MANVGCWYYDDDKDSQINFTVRKLAFRILQRANFDIFTKKSNTTLHQLFSRFYFDSLLRAKTGTFLNPKLIFKILHHWISIEF